MNTEATQDHQEANTTGARLRHAREQLGLSQQAVAERLCLKVSTVRDIEDDKAPADLASTFLRGYIRSYARLVHIPEDELLPMMAKQAPIRAAKVAPMQKFLFRQAPQARRLADEASRLVLFVVIGLSGARWWQDHKAQQEEISTMADRSSAELNGGDANSQNVPLDTSAPAAPTADSAANSAPTDTASAPTTSAPVQTPADNNAVVAPSRPMSIPRGRRRQLRLPPSLAVADRSGERHDSGGVGAGSGDELFRRLLAGSERCHR